ncbi:Transposon Ty3-I Gag-Pol polyprotein [Ceratobasidium sp. AG-Ba]|nr:Transposon Ty3-I Gag-Pol polyprotein [Ceratobasidium sp. AG-Ba]
MAHFNGLHTDLQTIFDQIQAIPSVQRPQLTGTNRQPPPPPVRISSTSQPPPVRVTPPIAPTTSPPLSKSQLPSTCALPTQEHLDDDKIAFIISYLDGKASEWIEPHMEHDNLRQAVPWLHDVNLFWAEFEKRFGEIDQATKALKKLKSLKQKSSVQDYVTEFQSLAAYVNYNDLALRDMFYEGLKDEIKMAMLSQLFDVKDNATTGQMVVDRALLIDQHLEQFAG